MSRFPRTAQTLSALSLSALLVTGCNDDSASGPAAQQPDVQESSLSATWSMDQSTPVGAVRVTMAVDAAHTMVVTVQKAVTVEGGATVMVDAQKEAMSWSLKGNVMTSVKTDCQYAGSDGTLAKTDCAAPTQETANVSISNGKLTVVKGEMIYVFAKQ